MLGTYNRVFAALDGSAAQREVAERALSIAEANQAELVFGHVVDSVPFEASGTDFVELCDEMHAKLIESLEDLVDKGRKSTELKAFDVRVCAGRVTDALVEQLIKPYDPDVVVCGERGLSNLQYALLGSVSTHLIRSLRCDVLVVKQETK